MLKHKRFILTAIFVISMFLMLTVGVQAATDVGRIKGDDRYKTAVEVSKTGWNQSSEFAILATGENFPDALGAAPLAKLYKAPILLTEKDSLNSDTSAELKRLGVKDVLIVGGEGVISKNIEEQIKALGMEPYRIAGADRYETSVKIADIIGVNNGVIAVTGSNFPDAVSVSTIAAKKGMPIILVPQDSLTQSIMNFISDKKPQVTYVIGSTSEISDNVLSQLPNARRIGGNNIFSRNINIIKEFSSELNFDTIYMATGNNYPDALSASVLAQNSSSPILLLDSVIPAEVNDFIQSKVIKKIVLLGGPGAVSENIETTLKGTSLKITSLKDIVLEVGENEQYELPKKVTAVSPGGETELPVISWKLVSVGSGKNPDYNYEGTVEGYDKKAKLTIKVKSELVSISNITDIIIQYQGYTFPKTVTARYSDGSTKSLAVTWNTSIVNLSKTGTYNFEGTVEGYTGVVSLTLKILADIEIQFKDDNLEDEVREKIRKTSSSKDIFLSDVLDIESLKFDDADIEDLSGLEHFKNLRSLDLGENNISDLSPLEELTNLEELKLDRNYIEDLTPLSKLTKLTYLDLRNNYISDIWALKFMTKLTALYLDENPIEDYTPTKAYYDNLDKKDFDLDLD